MKKKLPVLILTAALSAGMMTGCLSSSVTPPADSAPQTQQSAADPAADSDTEKTVIKISFAGGDTHPIMKTLEEFEKMFEERTEGRYDV